MIDQPQAFLLLFTLVFGLNLIPAFAPPTWMALTVIGFQFHDTNPVLLSFVGAVAATLGRLCLAKLSYWLLRRKFLNKAHRKNIDVIRQRLEKRVVLTFGLFLFYAFSPLPSNFLFIAYGMTTLPLFRVALPFFIGRIASYSFFATGAALAGRRFQIDSLESAYYATGWFIASQILFLGALYAFTQINWKALFDEHRFLWLSRSDTAEDGKVDEQS